MKRYRVMALNASCEKVSALYDADDVGHAVELFCTDLFMVETITHLTVTESEA